MATCPTCRKTLSWSPYDADCSDRVIGSGVLAFLCMMLAVPACSVGLYVLGIVKWVVVKTLIGGYHYIGMLLIWLVRDMLYYGMLHGVIGFYSEAATGVNVVWMLQSVILTLLFKVPVVSHIVSLLDGVVAVGVALIQVILELLLSVLLVLARFLRLFSYISTLGMVYWPLPDEGTSYASDAEQRTRMQLVMDSGAFNEAEIDEQLQSTNPKVRDL